MKISIIGGGNMGGAIVQGLIQSKSVKVKDITVINKTDKRTPELKSYSSDLNVAISDYSSLEDADIVILGVKPWLVEDVIKANKTRLQKKGQLLISVAGGITLEQLEGWMGPNKAIYRVIPNTAIAVGQSMTFIASKNATKAEDVVVNDLFSNLGKVESIEEKNFSGATSLSSCGIAFAFRYIRAAMEGGVEMGLYPTMSRDIVLQTLRGAVELLEANNSHPESEIDKVTTPGGMTIKGLNEMEHAGFTSSVIKGLKASNVR